MVLFENSNYFFHESLLNINFQIYINITVIELYNSMLMLLDSLIKILDVNVNLSVFVNVFVILIDLI